MKEKKVMKKVKEEVEEKERRCRGRKLVGLKKSRYLEGINICSSKTRLKLI